MKISAIFFLAFGLSLLQPALSKPRGTRVSKNAHVEHQRRLKGDDGDEDDDEGGLGDIVDTITEIVDAGCFSASATVQVQNKGPVAMKDLLVGDKVLTSNSYQAVYAFGHLAEEAAGDFVQLNTPTSVLEMTGEHMVFLEGKANPVRADSIKVGDVLRGESAPAPVTNIGSVTKKGLYAPLTKEGTLVVDGIVASSYISLQENAPEFIQVQGVNMAMSQHSFVHLTLSPFRMMCNLVGCESYNENGMAPFVANAMGFVQWAETQHLLVQLLILAAVLVLAAACMFVENLSFASVALAGAYAITQTNAVSFGKKVKTV